MPSDAWGDGVVHPEPRKGPFQGPSLRTRRLEEFTFPLLFCSRRRPGSHPGSQADGAPFLPPDPPVGLDTRTAGGPPGPAHRTAAHWERTPRSPPWLAGRRKSDILGGVCMYNAIYFH